MGRLILTRTPGETIVIGDEGDIMITIVSVRGNQVRLSVDAARSIPVHREEVYLRIQQEKEDAKNQRT